MKQAIILLIISKMEFWFFFHSRDISVAKQRRETEPALSLLKYLSSSKKKKKQGVEITRKNFKPTPGRPVTIQTHQRGCAYTVPSSFARMGRGELEIQIPVDSEVKDIFKNGVSL